MSEPVFIISHIDRQLEGVSIGYYARNWQVSVSDNQMHFHGDFVCIAHRDIWKHTLSQKVGTIFEVKLGGQRDEELMQEAEDKLRVKKLSDHLIGLTEKFIESNLSHEFKEILKRTPTTVTEMGELMAKGLNKALEKLGKGK